MDLWPGFGGFYTDVTAGVRSSASWGFSSALLPLCFF